MEVHEHPPARAASSAGLKDPVCGMHVTPESQHKYEHGGATYFFCSAGCRAKFAAGPEKYLQKQEADQPHTAVTPLPVAGAQYTCPMHPEIVRDKPVFCEARHAQTATDPHPNTTAKKRPNCKA